MTQKIAAVAIRPDPHYRRQAFADGLRRAGYTLDDTHEGGPGDVLVTWNRAGPYGDRADQWEARGGLVLVAENGYIGADENGVQFYALAVHGHNGSGVWYGDGPERLARLHLDVKPWRTDGHNIIIRGQRGIGSRTMASPPQWHVSTARYLARHSTRRQIVQDHPGKPACDPRVADELARALQFAWCMCIWSSAAGVRALVEGVPVFYAAPNWICQGAALAGMADIESPMRDDAARQRALERMAWAQWSVAELASGEPFILLAGLA